MVTVSHQTIAAGPGIAQVTRPARALVGWIPSPDAELVLAAYNTERARLPEYVEQATRARQAVQVRSPFPDTAEIVTDPGPEIAAHISELIAQPAFDPFRAEGWHVKIADLSKVCALQPVVFWDHAEERTQSAVPGDMASLAEVTLPVRRVPEQLPFQFDKVRNAWMVASRNPNLRIVLPFNAPVQADTGQQFQCLGFLVSIAQSFVQIAYHRGRYILRDGYHRSLGLLARGMTHVPVLYREFSEFGTLGLGEGMLPPEQYLGKRPPLLADYLTDTVAAAVDLPATQKMLVVHGMELNPIG
jgi:hypothetical protein